MLSKSKYIALICGGISIAVTVIFYLLTFDNILTVPMRWVSLTFLVSAEAIGTIKAFSVKRTIFGVANILTSLVHIAVVLIISIIFVNFLPLFIKRYILLNVLALCALLIADVIILYFTNNVAAQNAKMAESQSAMRFCTDKASSMCVEFKDTEYRRDLDEIVDLLKYSDNSSLTQDEMGIMNQLDRLQLLLKNNDDGIAGQIIEIKNAIKMRSIKAASTKYGSY